MVIEETPMEIQNTIKELVKVMVREDKLTYEEVLERLEEYGFTSIEIFNCISEISYQCGPWGRMTNKLSHLKQQFKSRISAKKKNPLKKQEMQVLAEELSPVQPDREM